MLNYRAMQITDEVNMRHRCPQCRHMNLTPKGKQNAQSACAKCGAHLPVDASGNTSAALGLFGGAVLGGAVGGPAGAFVGGIVGAILGHEAKGMG